jgi:hypothetical protein
LNNHLPTEAIKYQPIVPQVNTLQKEYTIQHNLIKPRYSITKAPQTHRPNYDSIAQQYLQSYDNTLTNKSHNTSSDPVAKTQTMAGPPAVGQFEHDMRQNTNLHSKSHQKIVDMRDTKSHGPIKAPAKNKKSKQSKYICDTARGLTVGQKQNQTRNKKQRISSKHKNTIRPTTSAAFSKKTSKQYANRPNRRKMRESEAVKTDTDLADMNIEGFNSPPNHHKDTLFSTYGESVASKRLINYNDINQDFPR